MKRADEILHEAAETFAARNKVYGDNYKNVGAVMRGLFPGGVTLTTEDDWNRMHILLLKAVKLTRYAINWEGGHQDSIRDDTVYGAMLEMIDGEIAARGVKFSICEKCHMATLCSLEQHCDLKFNGYR